MHTLTLSIRSAMFVMHTFLVALPLLSLQFVPFFVLSTCLSFSYAAQAANRNCKLHTTKNHSTKTNKKHKYRKQSSNQPIGQPTNSPDNQPTNSQNQPTNHPTNNCKNNTKQTQPTKRTRENNLPVPPCFEPFVFCLLACFVTVCATSFAQSLTIANGMTRSHACTMIVIVCQTETTTQLPNGQTNKQVSKQANKQSLSFPSRF
jgi:hypothetical protein